MSLALLGSSVVKERPLDDGNQQALLRRKVYLDQVVEEVVGVNAGDGALVTHGCNP